MERGKVEHDSVSLDRNLVRKSCAESAEPTDWKPSMSGSGPKLPPKSLLRFGTSKSKE